MTRDRSPLDRVADALTLLMVALTLYVAQFALLFEGMSVGLPPGLASIGLQVQAFITILFAALVIAIICVILPPFAILPAGFLAYLAWRRRQQADRKHAGLRVLR